MTIDVLDRPQTSAEAPMHPSRARPIIIGRLCTESLIGGPGFGSTTANSEQLMGYGGTQAVPDFILVVPDASHARAIHDIRLMSGLTWEELGKLFRVTRRSIHNWANGEPLKPEHALAVGDVLRAIQKLRRASAAETRLAILASLPSGSRGLDLLAAKKWDAAIAGVMALPPIPVPAAPHPDAQKKHPTVYFGALTDRPVPTSGHAIPGRSRRVPRRGQ